MDWKSKIDQNGRVVIRKGTKKIDDCAFEGCENLVSVEIPDSVRTIGYKAFAGCTNLETIVIPEGVKVIEGGAFTGPLASGLRSLDIPASIIEIRDDFDYCSSLESITVSPDNENYCSKNNCLLSKDGTILICGCKTSVIPDGVKEIAGTLRHLKNLEIPQSVEKIDKYYCFTENPDLESITVAEENNYYCSKNNCLLSKDGKNLLLGCKNSIIPAGVIKIENSAFEGCKGLTNNIVIPKSVGRIGMRAFEDCTGIESVVIAHKNVIIESWAFHNCTRLTSISLPEGVDLTEQEVFSGCTALTSLVIPRAAKLGDDCFCDCTSLKELSFAGELDEVDGFHGCESLSNVEFPDGIRSIGGFSGTSITHVLIPDSVHTITHGAFGRCPIESIVIPDSVSNIEGYAFANCAKLSDVYISNNITVINPYTFEGCCNLKEITIPDRVSVIENHAFYKCTSLTSINIPDSVKEIGWCAFWECTNLTSVKLPDGLKKIDEMAFADCDSLSEIVIPSGIRIKEGTFPKKVKISRNKIKTAKRKAITEYNGKPVLRAKDIESLEKAVFDYNGSLTPPYVVIFSGKTKVKESAFSKMMPYVYIENKDLGIIFFPDTVESIDWGAFGGCTALTEVHFNESLKYLDRDAFRDCSSLVSLEIPKDVRELKGAFIGCSGLTSIKVNPENGFYDSRDDCNAVIRKSDDALVLGCSNTLIPSSVRIIEEHAFEGCKNLKAIAIPNSVTKICSRAFRECENLAEITIPDSVTSIGKYAFEDCTGLTEIHIKNPEVLKDLDLSHKVEIIVD